MYAAIQAAFADNHGLITAARAEQLGVDANHRRQLVANGTWVAVRRGVYVEAERWTSADETTERRRLRSRAAHLVLAAPHVMSHDSAAIELGLPFLKPAIEFVHLTRPDERGSKVRSGVKYHGASFLAEQVIEVDGLPLLDRARTALDLAREYGYAAGVAAMDAAMQRGVTRVDLERALAPMHGWPRSRAVRAALADADSGAETIGESLSRLLVMELGLGRPQTQFPMQLAREVVWVDMLLGCHAIEFDGKVKYVGRADGGLADRPAAEVIWNEKQRQTEICGEGLGMSRVVWADLWGARRERAKARIRKEYAVTLSRFGDRLPEHLERFAAEMRARGGRRRVG